MNICIGGPWHGSKFLTSGSPKSDRFKVKDQSRQVITYIKRIIRAETRPLIFWIDSTLTEDQVSDFLEDYLRTRFVFYSLDQ